ncbi:MAG: hypothetical protein AAF636_02275 [Pseudomonadota bacterium]
MSSDPNAKSMQSTAADKAVFAIAVAIAAAAFLAVYALMLGMFFLG